MRGVQLFDERRFGDALPEFERSYALYPAFGTLYNIGEVRVALGHPVEAVDAFERFLAQGGESIPSEQRGRVEAELRLERARVGDVRVTGLPAGSEVRVDGTPVAKAPMTAPVRVAAGHHRLEAMADGYRSALREIDVSGQGHIELGIPLTLLSMPTAPAAGASVPSASQPAATSNGPAEAALPTAPGRPAPGAAQRIVAYCVAALGLATTGAGIAVAEAGQAKHDEALTQYASNQKQTAVQTEADSVHEKNIGYVTMGVGGGVFLAGIIVYLTAPTGRRLHSALGVSPWIGTSAAGATLGGAW
jgi:hypothetical protein